MQIQRVDNYVTKLRSWLLQLVIGDEMVLNMM